MRGRSVRLTVMSLLLTTVAIAGMQMAFECSRCGLTDGGLGTGLPSVSNSNGSSAAISRN